MVLMNKCTWDETGLKPCEMQALDCSSCGYYQEEQSANKCVDCYHYKVCAGFGFILDPLHGGVICEDFIKAANVMEIKHGRWIIPTKIGIRSFNIPHCSVCDGVPCGVDSNTKYCPECGAKMNGEKLLTWIPRDNWELGCEYECPHCGKMIDVPHGSAMPHKCEKCGNEVG